MANRGSKDEIEWDDEELDTQIFERDSTDEPELLETRDIFEDDDDRTVANEPPPDVLRAATAPQLATPQPQLTGRGGNTPAVGASGARIPAPPPGRVPGPPAGAPKTLFGMPAPHLPAPPAPSGRVPTPSPGPSRATRNSVPSFPAPQVSQTFEVPVQGTTVGPMAPKPKGRGATMFLLLVLAVGGAVAGGYYWYQNRAGKVEIATTPPEATVLVDNVKVAEKTPFTLERPPGPYTISVVRPGYTRNDQSVVVHSGQSANLAVTLEPSADTGFELTSVPPGGLVWLDGNPMAGPDGQARTDFRAYKIPPGKHLFEIKGDPKLQPWSEEVVIEPGVIKKVKANLVMVGEPSRGGATSAGQQGGGPAVDQMRPDGGGRTGAGAGAGGPLALGGGQPRRRATRPTRDPRSDDDSSSPSRADDSSSGGGGDCTITVGTRPWSEVWIDGRNTGRHTPYSESIPCGKHKLMFRRPDMNLTRNESVVIRPGEKFRQSYPLEEEE